MSKIKKIGTRNKRVYTPAKKVPRVTKEQLRAERYEQLKFKNRFAVENIGGFELLKKKKGKITAEEVWKYQSKEIEKLFENYDAEMRKKAKGFLRANISPMQRFKSLFLSYKGNYEKLIKDLTFSRPQSAAEYAYQILKDTGRIEDLAAMANEEINPNKIIYQRNNYYTYRAENGKVFLFEISYQKDGGNSIVDVEITEI